ncbi:MAG: magnesium/cobalt transporter CorA [Chloroflexi bacterium]|nr:magnesium/cobalt transporter CorA [Chloroflexota bacterium]
MRIVQFTAEGQKSIEKPDWAALMAQAGEGNVFWVDLAGPSDEDVRLMHDTFHFHPLAIEDTKNGRQRPKVEEYKDHLFVILNPVNDYTDELSFRELDVFMTHQYVVTVHADEKEPIVDSVMRRCATKIDAGQKITVGFLIYALADAVVDLYFPLLDTIGDEIEDISESIIEKPRREDLNHVFRLKRALAEMWRVAGQQRDMFNVFTRENLNYIDEEIARYYMRDIYDHLLRTSDTVNTFRDTMSGVIDVYLSSVSNRLDIIVQRLTVVTIGIGVLTVISGFYGMNFEHNWPPFGAAWGVPFVLLLMFIGLIGVMVLFWRKE